LIINEQNLKEDGKPKILLNTKVISLDVDAHTAKLENGHVVKYHKVLIATGVRHKIPFEMKDKPNISSFKTVLISLKLD
jgi:NAD(P)H-nitrite reductase large subunit